VPAGAPEVILRWNGAVGAAYLVEASSDLVAWSVVSAEVIEQSPGVFQAQVPGAGRWQFYRVRRVATSSDELVLPLVPRVHHGEIVRPAPQAP
jgi:hypothetical protein